MAWEWRMGKAPSGTGSNLENWSTIGFGWFMGKSLIEAGLMEA
jgi:hypothetical protein